MDLTVNNTQLQGLPYSTHNDNKLSREHGDNDAYEGAAATRRLSYMERLRQHRQSREFGFAEGKRKSSEEEKLLLQNVKDMLRQGVSISEITKVTEQLIGVGESSNSMEVDTTNTANTANTDVQFQKSANTCYSRRHRRHRESYHVSIPQTDTAVTYKPRGNSVDCTPSNFDSYSPAHLSGVREAVTSQQQRTRPAWNQHSLQGHRERTEPTPMAVTNTVPSKVASLHPEQQRQLLHHFQKADQPLGAITGNPQMSIGIPDANSALFHPCSSPPTPGFHNIGSTSGNVDVNPETGWYSPNPCTAASSTSSPILKRHLSFLKESNHYNRQSKSEQDIDYERILFGPNVKKTRL